MRRMATGQFSRAWLASLLVVALAVPTLPAAAQGKETPQGKQWAMKYEDGTEKIQQGTEMKVTVGKETILCDTGNKAPFSIPVSSITEVSYDTKSRRRLAEAAAVAALSLGVAAVFAALKTKKHYVNILWQEAGSGKEAIFKIGKGDYASFLAELQRVTGKEWKNLEMEHKRVQEELKREQSKKIALQLDRQVRVGESTLAPGLYQLIFLEQKGSEGTLYFFAGKEVNTEKIAAAALVEVVTQPSEIAAAQVTYKGEGSTAMIAEIRTPAKTFRFR